MFIDSYWLDTILLQNDWARSLSGTITRAFILYFRVFKEQTVGFQSTVPLKKWSVVVTSASLSVQLGKSARWWGFRSCTSATTPEEQLRAISFSLRWRGPASSLIWCGWDWCGEKVGVFCAYPEPALRTPAQLAIQSSPKTDSGHFYNFRSPLRLESVVLCLNDAE